MIRLEEHGGVFGGRGKRGALNVFSQLHEPDEKEGVWIKTDRKFDDVFMSDKVFNLENTTIEQLSALPTTDVFSVLSAVLIDAKDAIHVLTDSNPSRHFRFDYTKHTWEELSLAPTHFRTSPQNSVGVEHKGDIYVFGTIKSWMGAINRDIYKYDIENKTWTQLERFPFDSDNIGDSLAVSFENYIYLMHSGRIYRYEPDIEKFTEIGSGGSSTNIRSYVFDDKVIWQNEYFDLRTEKIVSSPQGVNWSSYGSPRAIAVNNCVFWVTAPQSNDKELRYHDIYSGKSHKLNTFIAVPSLFSYYGEYVYMLDSRSGVYRFNVPLSNGIEQNTVIIFRQGDLYDNFRTEIVSSLTDILGDENRLDVPFTTAQLYHDEELQTYPVYYGTGIDWEEITYNNVRG